MPWLIRDPERLRRNLRDKTLYVFIYCHADFAWTHTRLWHVNRYVKVLDEVLDLLDSDPQFRYFIDSWSEMLQPYLEARPESRGRIAGALKDRRLSLCGSQWANLRMTQTGAETTVRNIVLGRRAAARLTSDFEPTVYANLDVAIGHSQVPQLMRLGGYRNYLAWRPSAGLDRQGIPRSFVWQGLSGHRVTVSRMCYGTGNSVPEGTWDADWDRSLDCLGPDLEVAAAQPGVRALGLFISMDDTRPLRLWGGDQPARTDELIRAWNSSGIGLMGYGTPEELFRHLSSDALPVVAGTLDEAEVCYNLNWRGHRSLAWWREKADRALVQAELLDAVAALRGGISRQYSLDRAWRLLLDSAAHAEQMLFAEDEQERYLALTQAEATAQNVFDDAARSLLPVCLPVDCTHLALLNPSSTGGRRVIRALVPNHDRAMSGFALLDEQGARLPVQFTEAVTLNDEFEAEFILDLPPCGVRACRLQWRPEPADLPEHTALARNTEVKHGDLVLRFAGGHLTEMENVARDVRWEAAGLHSLLMPSVQTYTGGTWLPDSLSAAPLRGRVRSLEMTDAGPVRTRITREVEVGINLFRQHLDVYGALGEVRCTTEMLLRHEGIFAGIVLPTPPDADLTVDIPFGVESRSPSSVPYGAMSDVGYENLERRIPGLFWGRSWIAARAGGAAAWLLSEDGDRFFWQHPSREWLMHFFLRVPHAPGRNWEHRATVGQAIGRHVFHHVLALHGPEVAAAELVRRAEQLRFPVRCIPVRLQAPMQPDSWITIEPDLVQMSAFYAEGPTWILRVYNPQPASVTARIALPSSCLSAIYADFNLQGMEGEVSVEGRTLGVKLAPWQIATLLLRF